MKHSVVIIGIFVSLIAKIARGQAASCNAGTYRFQSKCILCPAGTYQYKKNQSSCTPCPAGTFNPFRGVQGPDLCRRCATGFFSSERSTKCTRCAKGTDSREGFSTCLSCSTGSEISFRGEFCELCRPGTYWLSFSKGCVSCPTGFSSPSGSISADDCFRCSPGFEANGPCSACGERLFRNGDMERCAFCPLGTITTTRGNSECQLCPAGTFKDSEISYKCMQCPTGTTSRPGSRVCRKDDGSPCPSGQFEDARGNCVSCAPGEYRNLKTNVCTKCSSNTEFSKGGLVTMCEKCGKDAVQTFNGGGCICRDGKQFSSDNVSCELCPPGTDGSCPLPLGQTCYMCRIGQYNPFFGSTGCLDCPEGTTTFEKGATKCTKCPKGTIPRTIEAPGSEPCVLPQTNCQGGFDRIVNSDGSIRRCIKRQVPSPAPPPSSIPKMCQGRCYNGRKIIKCRWRLKNKCLVTFVTRTCNGRKYNTCVVKQRVLPRNCMDACMALPYWRKLKLEANKKKTIS